MDDPALVRVLQRLRDVQEHWNDVQVAGAAQPAQIAAGSELHRQHHRVGQVMWRIDLQHGSMIQTARDRMLALERGQHGFPRRAGRVRYLQCNIDPAGVIVGAPYFTLTARTQFFEQRKTRVQTPTFERGCKLSHDLMGLEGAVQVPV